MKKSELSQEVVECKQLIFDWANVSLLNKLRIWIFGSKIYLMPSSYHYRLVRVWDNLMIEKERDKI